MLAFLKNKSFYKHTLLALITLMLLFICWLKYFFWKTQDSNWVIKKYHRFLVWDLMDKPVFTRTLEKILNPIMGKSVVLYFRKEAN